MSLITCLGLVGLIAAPAAAFWRLPCKSPIVVERADPVVNPGKVSGHVHTIMGGNGFDFEMDYNSTQASTCSSCTVIGDHSNYWTPTLWYQNQDGSFESVDQVGGATVYYLQRGGSGEKLKAFPPGFRMIAGDPFKRTGGTDFPSQAISYNCLDYNGAAKPETGGFPNYNCPNGLRAQVFFPSCWNGKDLDTADHKSHMSYPVGAFNSGSCPPDFPVHLVSLFFEIIWDTPKFANRWYGSGQPFVWSMGDPTGYGGHGDFVMGWEEEHLQSAIDQCTSNSGRVEDCPVFDLIPDTQAEGCRIPAKIDEATSGKLTALPGCNPVQAGPNRATPQSTCDASTTISDTASAFFKDLTSQGWSYVGCGTDNYYTRILTGASTSQADMTNEKCIGICESKGFSVAGTEYSKECYCGNSIPVVGLPTAGVVGNCQMPCAGDATEMCGGAGPISLYQKCPGSTCANAQIGPVAPVNVAVPSSAPTTAAALTSPTTMAASVMPTTATSAESRPDYADTSESDSGGYTEAPKSDSPASSSSSSSTTSLPSAPASSPSSSPPSSSSSSSSPSSGASLPSGWSYSGCKTDTVFPRSLPTWSNFNGPSMTNFKCAAFCDSKGFSMAGTEYAGQCFCGNALVGSTDADESKCNKPCTGASGEMCGGAGTLSVYTKSGASKRRAVHLHRGKHGQRARTI